MYQEQQMPANEHIKSHMLILIKNNWVGGEYFNHLNTPGEGTEKQINDIWITLKQDIKSFVASRLFCK